MSDKNTADRDFDGDLYEANDVEGRLHVLVFWFLWVPGATDIGFVSSHLMATWWARN